MTVEYEIEVPADWDAAQIEFHRNESSWCSNNAIQELEKLFGRDDVPCICDATTFKYVGNESEPQLDEK